MTRVFVLTFGFLAVAWYELSGGKDFVPGQNGVEMLATYVPPAEEVHEEPLVVRANTGAPLNSMADALPAALRVAQPVERVEVATFQQVAALDTPIVMTDAAPEPVAEPAVVVAAASSIDYRKVTGSRVNLRQGPGTSFDVVTQLLRDEEVEVMDQNADGWVKLRALDGNDIGWMLADFLVAVN